MKTRQNYKISKWIGPARCAGLLLILSFCLPLFGATDFEITANVSITNTPAGLPTNIVVNLGTADTRRWTNNATAAPASNIQTTNTPAASVTNLINHFLSYPVYSVGVSGPRAFFQYSTNVAALTNFTITAPRNTNLTVTIGGGWASVSYTTQFFAAATAILTQTNAISAEQRTNAANAIVNFLAAISTTNVIPLAMNVLRNYTDTNTAQTIGNKTFISPILSGGRAIGLTNATGTNVAFTNATIWLVAIGGISDLRGFLGSLTNGTLYSNTIHFANISNAIALGGNIYRVTNGLATNLVLLSPKLTNGVNYGNAFSSPGAGALSEQFGAGSLAYGAGSLALGNQGVATNDNSLIIGTGVVRESGIGIGLQNITVNTNNLGIGHSIYLGGNGAISAGNVGVGHDIDDNDFVGLIMIGNGISATTSNRIYIGSSAYAMDVQGLLIPEGGITNHVTMGTNRVNARTDFGNATVSTLVNGYNSAVPVGNYPVIKFSGPSGAYTNRGFVSPGGPQFAWFVFDNPVNNMTIMNDDGGEFSTNRIYTTTGGLVNFTNNPVSFPAWYDTSVTHWRMLRALP